MTYKQHDPGGPQGIPLSAVYRQLDDHPAPEAAEYDPAAAVAQLLARWASDGPPARPRELADLPVHEAAVQMLTIRRDLVLQLARRRFTSSATAYAVILAISGSAAAAAAFIPHVAALVLAGVALTAVLTVFAVVIVHQITMRSITRDHDRILSEDSVATGTDEEQPLITGPAVMRPAGYRRPEERPDPLIAEDQDYDDWPRSRRLRLRLPLEAAAVIGVAITAAIHDGTSGIILLAVTLGVFSLALLGLMATALFGTQSLSERAFRLIRAPVGFRRDPEVMGRRRRLL